MSAKKRRKIPYCKLEALPHLISLRSSECSYCSRSAHHQPGPSSFSAELMPGRPAPLYVLVGALPSPGWGLSPVFIPQSWISWRSFWTLPPACLSISGCQSLPSSFLSVPPNQCHLQAHHLLQVTFKYIKLDRSHCRPLWYCICTGIRIRYDLLITTLWS